MDLTLNNQQIFPAGTTVKAYKAANWPQSVLPASGAPLGAADDEVVVAANGAMDFTGLADDTRYFAVAQVGGVWRYVRFVTATPPLTADAVASELDALEAAAASKVELNAEKARAEAAEALKVTAAKIGDIGLDSRHQCIGYVPPVGNTAPTAKVIRYVPIYIAHPCKLTGIVYSVGEVSNGKVIVALYNKVGERKAVSAATAQSAANNIQQVPFEVAFDVPQPALYWLALLMETATGTFQGSKCLHPWKEATEATVAAPAAFVPSGAVNNSGNKAPVLATY